MPEDIDYNKLHKILIEFAESQPLVTAVRSGIDPEDGRPIYYFLTKNAKYNESLSDAIRELEIELIQKEKINVGVMRYLINPYKQELPKFLEEMVWERT